MGNVTDPTWSVRGAAIKGLPDPSGIGPVVVGPGAREAGRVARRLVTSRG
jgi:hypothetical protein